MKKMHFYFLLCFVTANLQAQNTSFVNGGKESCLTTQPVMSTNASYVVFGMCANLDARFTKAGIFAAYTTIAGTRFDIQTELIKK